DKVLSRGIPTAAIRITTRNLFMVIPFLFGCSRVVANLFPRPSLYYCKECQSGVKTSGCSPSLDRAREMELLRWFCCWSSGIGRCHPQELAAAFEFFLSATIAKEAIVAY